MFKFTSRVLGKGSYGQVCLAQYRPTAQEVAIKIAESKERQEAETMKDLFHQNIEEFFGECAADSHRIWVRSISPPHRKRKRLDDI